MADEPGKNVDDAGQESQDEIDALLSAAADVAGEAAPESAAAAAAVPPDAGLSQADIDAAIAEGGEEDSGLVSQDEIDAVIAESEAPAGAGARVDAEGRPFDAAAAAMAAAIAEQKGAASEPEQADGDLPLDSVDLPDFTGEAEGDAAALQSIDLLHDVDLRVRIELGRTRMYVEDVLRLGEGSVVELDKLAGDPVDVFVNERLVARGEVLVLNDNFCVRVSEIIADENERIIV